MGECDSFSWYAACGGGFTATSTSGECDGCWYGGDIDRSQRGGSELTGMVLV